MTCFCSGYLCVFFCIYAYMQSNLNECAVLCELFLCNFAFVSCKNHDIIVKNTKNKYAYKLHKYSKIFIRSAAFSAPL